MSAEETSGPAGGGEAERVASAGGGEDRPQKTGRRRRSGRRLASAGGDSRAEILTAAREEFADYGYGRATIASIARRAHCDTALVHYFFGTKRDLFDAAITLPYDPGAILLEALQGAPAEGPANSGSVRAPSDSRQAGAPHAEEGAPRAALFRHGRGQQIVEQVLASWETDENRAVMVALMRSAASEDDAREVVQDLLVRKALLPAVEVLGVPDARRRAVLIGALIYGLMLVRHVVRMEPVATDPPALLSAAIGPVIDHYLFDDLDGES